MNIADPVAWTQIEDAMYDWIAGCSGIDADRVRHLVPRDDGEARGPAPKAVIRLISDPPTMQRGEETQLRITRQRYTVIADGPGEVGVDFYPGRSLTPQRISIVAGAGDPPATSAAALLGQLTADLPAGYTASADPEDTASVLVDGSEAEPLFTASTADAALLTVATPIPRFVKVYRIEHRITYRVEFRADAVSGPTIAADAKSRAVMYRRSLLDPAMARLGFRPAGTPLSESNVPTDRSESLAVLDVAFLGWFTGAEGRTPVRVAGYTQTAA